MKNTGYFIICFLISIACTNSTSNGNVVSNISNINQDTIGENIKKNSKYETIETRILPPKDFVRNKISKNSYSYYLRTLPLKPIGSKVLYFNNNIKENYNVYEAVIDLNIGDKNLHQCADAVIRLRAEYLWKQKEFDKIHFNLTNGFRVDYIEWMKGKRIKVTGNKTNWEQMKSPSNSYKVFWEYLELVFMYAGTLSLSQELKPIDIDDMKIGDVFIQGGSPGHAVLIVDIVINYKTKEKVFLLAQSYMPAQEIQILKNPNDNSLSPWYSIDFGNVLNTPEWTFYSDNLKRFE